MKTVAEMSEREQIERLIQQRNSLWRMLDELISEHGSDADKDDGDCPDVDTNVEEDGKITIVVSGTAVESLANARSYIDGLDKKLDDIVGNTYVIEGRNHRTGENNPDCDRQSFDPYLNAKEHWWFR